MAAEGRPRNRVLNQELRWDSSCANSSWSTMASVMYALHYTTTPLSQQLPIISARMQSETSSEGRAS